MTRFKVGAVLMLISLPLLLVGFATMDDMNAWLLSGVLALVIGLACWIGSAINDVIGFFSSLLR